MCSKRRIREWLPSTPAISVAMLNAVTRIGVPACYDPCAPVDVEPYAAYREASGSATLFTWCASKWTQGRWNDAGMVVHGQSAAAEAIKASTDTGGPTALCSKPPASDNTLSKRGLTAGVITDLRLGNAGPCSLSCGLRCCCCGCCCCMSAHVVVTIAISTLGLSKTPTAAGTAGTGGAAGATDAKGIADTAGTSSEEQLTKRLDTSGNDDHGPHMDTSQEPGQGAPGNRRCLAELPAF